MILSTTMNSNSAYEPIAKGGWGAVKNSIAKAEAKGEEAMRAMDGK